MPKPTHKGIWTEFHNEDKRYPYVWILHDEKPVAKFRPEELEKFMVGFNEDIEKLRKQVKENLESAERQREYERKYGRDSDHQ